MEQRLKLLEEKYSELALQYAKLQQEKTISTSIGGLTPPQGGDSPAPRIEIDSVKTETEAGDKESDTKASLPEISQPALLEKRTNIA